LEEALERVALGSLRRLRWCLGLVSLLGVDRSLREMPFGKIDVSCSGGAGDEAGREKELGHRRDEMLEHGLFPFPPGPLRTLSIGERQTSESRASPGGHPPGGALDDAQRDRAEIEQRSGDRRVCLPAVGAAGHDVELLDIE